jgi:oligopeptide/dipeptide ABC transporter ATP-binding protein
MNNEQQTNNNELLKVEGLKTWFPIKRGLLRRAVGHIKAVDGVSFNIEKSKTFGLVGESGCGKTTVARTIARLIPATDGQIIFDDKNILKADKTQLRQLRREISIIFQDPYGSLNPRMTVAGIVGEPLKFHYHITGGELNEKLKDLLTKVGLAPEHLNRYPHEFSGGQRQRIGVARALVLEPKLVICDEPVSALDVSIQSQILNLLKELQEKFGLTYLFIAHDLAVVEFLCDTVAVMYMGRIVELADGTELYANPLHPYTRALMSAIPTLERSAESRPKTYSGEVPSILNPPPGCPFHPRCPLADEQCKKTLPTLSKKIEDKNHYVACFKC